MTTKIEEAERRVIDAARAYKDEARGANRGYELNQLRSTLFLRIALLDDLLSAEAKPQKTERQEPIAELREALDSVRLSAEENGDGSFEVPAFAIKEVREAIRNLDTRGGDT